MGEIAEMMLDGTLCERCGSFIDGDSPGFPRLCSSCKPKKNKKNKKKVSIKALFINPFASLLSNRVEVIDLKIKENGDLDLEECYKILDCNLVQFVYTHQNKILVVDEEGLLKENLFFKIDNVGQQYFVGKALLVEYSEENNEKFIDFNKQDRDLFNISFPNIKRIGGDYENL